jgi:hypothetical protein
LLYLQISYRGRIYKRRRIKMKNTNADFDTYTELDAELAAEREAEEEKAKGTTTTDREEWLKSLEPMCSEHDERLTCKYCTVLEHFDNCPVFKKFKQCTCLLNRGKSELVCAYCGLNYQWIDHAHTRGFYEHERDGSEEPCRFIGHKILEEVETRE